MASFSIIHHSSAINEKTKEKVAIKKLHRPFQSEIFAKRAYRELRLLKHMKHENVRRLNLTPLSLLLLQRPRIELWFYTTSQVVILKVFRHYLHKPCDGLAACSGCTLPLPNVRWDRPSTG